MRRIWTRLMERRRSVLKMPHIDVRHGEVHKGPDNDEEVKGIPRIFEIVLQQRTDDILKERRYSRTLNLNAPSFRMHSMRKK